jgi:hypothetical protein
MFVHHPDGWVSLDGERIRLQALTDWIPAYSLPPGAVGRRYDGTRHVLHSATDQWAGETPWPLYDEIVAAWADITTRDAEITAAARPAPPDPWARPLPEIQADALGRVQQAAEMLRARVASPGDGQAMSYLAKATHAAEIIAGTRTASGLLEPLVGIEIDPATGQPCATLAEVAGVVASAQQQWEAIEGQIDAARRAARLAILAAPDAAAIQSAEAAITWPEIPEISG